MQCNETTILVLWKTVVDKTVQYGTQEAAVVRNQKLLENMYQNFPHVMSCPSFWQHTRYFKTSPIYCVLLAVNEFPWYMHTLQNWSQLWGVLRPGDENICRLLLYLYLWPDHCLHIFHNGICCSYLGCSDLALYRMSFAHQLCTCIQSTLNTIHRQHILGNLFSSVVFGS